MTAYAGAGTPLWLRVAKARVRRNGLGGCVRSRNTADKKDNLPHSQSRCRRRARPRYPPTLRLRAGGREALHRDLTGVDIRNVPQTEALARQKAFARRGVDRLVEIIATDGAIPCAHYQYPTIAVTTGEGEGKGFYAHAKTIVPDLKFTGSIVVATSLVDAWEYQ